MAGSAHSHSNLSEVALFPLPNVVLFPRAVLPLHIFEERYKAMTADLIESSGQLAMALLKHGWEKDYYGRPEIDSIVCVGNILNYEQLPNGQFNFLLQGHTRARVIREHEHHPYRIADLEPIVETSVPESDLREHREQMTAIFDSGSLLASVIGRQFRQLLCTAIPTADIADLIAFNFLDDLALKQSLLAESDVMARVTRIVQAFEVVRAPMKPSHTSHSPSLN